MDILISFIIGLVCDFTDLFRLTLKSGLIFVWFKIRCPQILRAFLIHCRIIASLYLLLCNISFRISTLKRKGMPTKSCVTHGANFSIMCSTHCVFELEDPYCSMCVFPLAVAHAILESVPMRGISHRLPVTRHQKHNAAHSPTQLFTLPAVPALRFKGKEDFKTLGSHP
jgi:hypothetical protein